MVEEKKSLKIIYILVLAVTAAAFFVLLKNADFNRENYIKPAQARNDMIRIMSTLVAYHKEFSIYPSSESYSAFLDYQPDPTYNTEIPKKDPWGNLYIYESPGPEDLPYRITSPGADKDIGGIGSDADIVSDEILKELLESIDKKKDEKQHR